MTVDFDRSTSAGLTCLFFSSYPKVWEYKCKPVQKRELRVSKAMARTVERIEEDIAALEEALSALPQKSAALTVVILR